jgi:hypothetical protein
MTTFTTSDGTVLHHEDRQGSGDVIVRVHGHTGSMRDWDETVLMVGGDRDNLVPVQTMLDSFARIPNCGLQIYHRVGHMVQLEVADEFAALVQDFAEHDAKKSEAAAARS